MNYSAPKGTFDIVSSSDAWKNPYYWQRIEEIARAVAKVYHYEELRTPIFEQTELFVRSVGETSDIISKEMYSFQDKGKRSMSLRPEGTAPALRAYIEQSLYHKGPHKLFYLGPFFRYDRPQAGRFRQFHQFGVESLGRDDPECDFELIHMIMKFFKEIGLEHLKLQINSIGTAESRAPYIQALRNYLKPHFSNLSKESQIRFEKNPLRILDTKNEKEQEILEEAPSILDFLDEESRAHFKTLQQLLSDHGLDYEIEPKLVRGLDYYNQTVFEISSDVLGAQNVIGAGGRYDGFLQQLGGPNFPGIGFACGLERILFTLEGQGKLTSPPSSLFVVLIGLGADAHKRALNLTYQLRDASIPVEIFSPVKKMQKPLKFADQNSVPYALILGEEEIKSQEIQLKNLKTRSSESIPQEQLIKILKTKWKEHAGIPTHSSL